ncbi:hypothetical protein ES705_33242 [subsurface metagenome]
MVKVCTYCGELIKGEVVDPGGEGELAYWELDKKMVLEPGWAIGFCSNWCAWRYGVESHKAYGMSGKAARRHLIDEHGLISPG